MMIAKAGTRVYGRVADAKQAGRYVGRSVLDLRLSELTVGGLLVPILTGPYIKAGKSSIAKTAKTTATGAAIGAIAGDAGKGAAIGATASGLKKGQPVVVSPGELLEFEIHKRLKLDLSFVWDRISSPQSFGGATPMPDDFRLITSLGIDF